MENFLNLIFIEINNYILYSQMWKYLRNFLYYYYVHIISLVFFKYLLLCTIIAVSQNYFKKHFTIF